MKKKSPLRYHPSEPKLKYTWTGFLLLGCSLAQPNCCVCVCVYDNKIRKNKKKKKFMIGSDFVTN